jgi:hypothetical protein
LKKIDHQSGQKDSKGLSDVKRSKIIPLVLVHDESDNRSYNGNIADDRRGLSFTD